MTCFSKGRAALILTAFLGSGALSAVAIHRNAAEPRTENAEQDISLRINGHSMQPSYKDGQTIWARRLAGETPLRRGAVYIIMNPRHPIRRLVKRLAAVPGDEWTFSRRGDCQTLAINREPYRDGRGREVCFRGSPRMLRHLASDSQGRVAEGAYMVLGESPNSLGSDDFGWLERTDFLAEVISAGGMNDSQ